MTTAEMLMGTGAIEIPWPSIIDGQIYNGNTVTESALCRERCKEKECRQSPSKASESRCKQGLAYFHLKANGHGIVVYGVTSFDKSGLPKYPLLKKQLKGRTVTFEAFRLWAERLLAFLGAVDSAKKELLSQALHPLHDTIRVAGEVRILAEKIVETDRSKSFEDNFLSARKEVKALYKAAEILVDTFDSAAIYFNPEAAKYGRPRDVEIYKLLDKLRLIMNISGANGVRRKIRLDGRGYGHYKLYESFKLLPLALLQNAIKYAQAGEVVLRADENDQGLKVEIVSEGPLIEQEEFTKIFEPGYRGKWALRMGGEGMGVGLHIAKTVADANGITIQVESLAVNRYFGDVPQARNVFWFVVHPQGCPSGRDA